MGLTRVRPLVHTPRVTELHTPPRKRRSPYDDAPRLPEGKKVDARSLVQGAWLELEVGPGRGGFLFERAEAAPEAGLVGVEIRRKWATIVDKRLAKAGFGARARVFAEDAKLALPRLAPDGAFRRAYLHFPDPWWKKKHQKRLVMGDAFMDEIARLLEPGGELFVQTDVEERADEYDARISLDPRFVPSGDVAGSARLVENPYGARSPREHRAIADGLPVHRFRYVRLAMPLAATVAAITAGS
jgi:tRNA (guanine-N7-)-methyltransferase